MIEFVEVGVQWIIPVLGVYRETVKQMNTTLVVVRSEAAEEMTNFWFGVRLF